MVRQVDDDRTLRELTRVLIDTLDPDRIILFGSRARGEAREDSDYDVAIEVEAPDLGAAETVAQTAVRDALGPMGLDIYLRRPGGFEARRDDPGYVDWDIVREGIVLYAAPNRPSRVRELPRPISSVLVWRKHAEVDLSIIDVCLAAPVVPWEGVCYHAQQAAEKYLKAAIVADGIRPHRSHDLADLVRQLRASRPALPDLSLECAALAKFAVQVRYPKEGDKDAEFTLVTATPEEGDRAVVAMRTILASVG